MRNSALRLLSAVLLGLCAAATASAADEISSWGRPIVDAVPTPSPPSIEAPSFILVDIDSGTILAQRRPHEPWKPASLTKMMTAYVVFRELSAGHIDLDDEVSISEQAWRTQGSRMFVEVGSHVAVRDLLQGMIIQSGNDAAVALAEHVAGDERTFAQVMNQEAERLGMKNTHYTNATGLPDSEMRTSAFDSARLAKAIIQDHPEYYGWYSQRSFTYAGIEQHNRNRLLWRDESVDGLKTGHTRAAGYNLTSSAQRGDMRLIAVVLGTANANARAQQSHQLLNYGFRFFETHRLVSAFQPLEEALGPIEEPVRARAWKGDEQHIELGVGRDLFVTIPRRERQNLRASIHVDDRIVAPVERGEPLGTLEIRLAGEVVHSEPLVAMHGVDEGGLWRRVIDDIWLRFQ